MPMNVTAASFASKPLLALYKKNILVQSINLAPNVSLPAGQVLSAVGTTAANDVQTLTIGGAATGGTFPLTGVNPLNGNTVTTTVPFAGTLTGALLQPYLTSAAMFGPGNVTVTGAAGGPYVITFVGALGNMPIAVLTTSAAGLTGGTPTAAVVHTTTGRSLGTMQAYAGAGAACLLKYATATDVNGLATYGLAGGGGEWGQATAAVPAYFTGTFRTQELVGLDAGAVTTLGRLLNGTIANGILDMQ